MIKCNKQGKILLTVVCLIALILITYLIYVVKTRDFEYFINGEIGKSAKCYQNEHQQCYCLINEKYQMVDGYYLVK